MPSFPPAIEDHGIIDDLQTVALVDGTVDMPADDPGRLIRQVCGATAV